MLGYRVPKRFGQRAPVTTIKDVARHVGLSITTVSRALNDYDDVSEATRTRIRAAAHVLDYHPNAAARSLKGRRADAIGLSIPPVLHRSYDAFWLDFIGGTAETCAERAVDLLLSMANAHDAEGRHFQRIVRQHRVDGMLVCDVRLHDARMAYLQRHHHPFLAFGRTAGPATYPYIDTDGTAGVCEAVMHLVALGHRRIAYLGVNPDYGFSYFRLAGYRAALQQAEAPYDPDLVCEGLDGETAPAAVSALLARPLPPTAIFAAADFLALTTLQVARAAGLCIPDDLSVISFDDNILVQSADPPLTAMSQLNRTVGREAASLLLDSLAHPEQPPAQRLIKPILVLRGSTAHVH